MDKNKKPLISLVVPRFHWKLKLLERWPEIVGNFAPHVILHRVFQDRLHLAATHPCWAQEFSLVSEQVLKEVHLCVGNADIKKIVFIAKGKKVVVGFFPRQSCLVLEKSNNQASLGAKLSDVEKGALSHIKSNSLRDSMTKILLRHKTLRSVSYERSKTEPKKSF